MERTKIFCIIVTYNALNWIDKCLKSLQLSTVEVFTIVVDNASNDDTVSYVEKYFPKVQIIKNNCNKGFGQANNQGIEYAYKEGATHFFLLNQDAWIEANTIEKLVNIQDSKNFSIVSPIHLNGTGDRLDFNFFHNILQSESNLEFVSDLILNRYKSFYRVSQINAAAWLLSKETIDNIGGFDPIFFHYGEDGNFCQRVKYHQGNIVFVPDSFIYHDRIFHGNQKVYNERRILSSLLHYYADISNSCFTFNKKIILLHLSNFKQVIHLFVRFKFVKIFRLFLSYIIFFQMIPKLVKSKKKNKIIGHNWLNI